MGHLMLAIGPLVLNPDAIPEPGAGLARSGDVVALLDEFRRNYGVYHAAAARQFARAQARASQLQTSRLPPSAIGALIRPTAAELRQAGLEGPSPEAMQEYLAACEDRRMAVDCEQVLRASLRGARSRDDVLQHLDAATPVAAGDQLLAVRP
jgi:hypothetical protein